VAPSAVWKLGLAAVLAALIIASASLRAPRTRLTWTELRWLLLGAMALYAVGLVAQSRHLWQAAILLFAAGIATSALAAWLSRGTDHGDGPPHDDDPIDEQPPPDFDGSPTFDWAAFERDLRAYAEHSREPASIR
jgi:hypothetical protein